ncbi:MAG: hypothetical protein GY765_29305 [bacterium]|nr:hypothetical protein [bacterium]
MKNEREQLKILENLFLQKRFSDAVAMGGQLHADFPNSYHINILYVKALKAENRFDIAENIGRNLLAVYQDNLNVLMEMGGVCSGLGKNDEALELFNKVLFLDPFNIEAKAAIEKIEAIPKNLDTESQSTDFLSYQKKKIREDTVPELSLDLDVAESAVFGGEFDDIPVVEDDAPAPQLDMSKMPDLSFESISDDLPPEAPPFATPEPEPLISQQPEIPVQPAQDLDMDFQSMPPEAPPFATPEPEPLVPQQPEIPVQPTQSLDMDFQAMPPEAPPFATPEPEPLIPQQPEIPVQPAQDLDMDFQAMPPEAPPFATPEPEPLIPQKPEIIPEPEKNNDPLTPEPVVTETQESTNLHGNGDQSEFVTQSTAELYLSQGLYDDALRIFETLYEESKDEAFLIRIKQLKGHRSSRKKIQALSEFLELIRQKGE